MVIVLFVVMLIGVLLGKMKVIDRHGESTLSFLIINVAMPMLIVASSNLEFDAETKKESLWLVIMAIIIFFFSIALAQLLLKKAATRCATVFSNAGYMGLPVLNHMLGAKGLFLGAIFQLVFNSFSWTYGISLFTRSNKFSDSIKKMINPSLFAVIIGLGLMFTGYKIPPTIKSVLDMVGGLTTPLSMILIGVVLSRVKFIDVIKEKEIYKVIFLRLILIPLSVLLFLFFPNIPRISIYVLFILNAMPSAAVTGILATKYKKDEQLASSIVAFSTLLSVLTLYLITDIFDVATLIGL